MIAIVKIGGSLEADPRRRQALLEALADGAHGRCIVVPGGGARADAVRSAQRRDGFGESEAHRRSLDAMSHAAGDFRGIEPRLVDTVEPWAGTASATAHVWNPRLLRAGHRDIPETWDVTSDSLALWLAARMAAERCVLVKSADAPAGRDAVALARSGLVDAAFPAFAARYGGRIEIWGPTGAVSVAARVAA
ncbi:uridylate kinase [Methylobacterium sp. J-070]|uniref:amino acid kinase family protein n=1 Tax=Methylobacterium sp. J-070 TaxID=2836650 RepID=UPI001FB88DE8|nr:uridylate kinase [Methylobacterium sp. J-070]MCJ2053128.1 uridylate kinase [Methylobacterium sp. J-070]